MVPDDPAGNRERGARNARLAAWVLLGLLAPPRIAAQSRVAGPIDFYGVQRAARPALLAALGLRPGDTLPDSEAALQRIAVRLTAVPPVRHARLELVCCAGDRYYVFAGVEEEGEEAVRFRAAPTGPLRIADTVRALSDSFQARLMDALRAGDAGDDLTAGHSLMHYPPSRAIQDQLLAYVAGHEAELRAVLRESADGESRAMAAWGLGYARDKRSVVADLALAAGDPDPEVRNNAVRALAAIGRLASLHPELGIGVPVEPFLRLLRSSVWTDRNKASLALFSLTEGRDPALLARLREARGPLAEMARWQSPGHALPAYFVLGRMAGISDSAAFAAFQGGHRERIIAPAEAP